MTLSKKQLRELSIDTMASWALDGLEPSAEIVSDIQDLVEGRMTLEEFIEKSKREIARLSPSVAELHEVNLAEIIYSAGRVFDDLGVSRTATETFLRSGTLDGITSRADLALLEDLRDVAGFIIDHRSAPIDSAYVFAVNAQITRSGPLHPGRFRSADQQIGVSTPHGRREPKPIDAAGLQQLIDDALAHAEPREQALELFVQIAKARPFEDGNKRTALFVANSVLIREPRPEMLVIPVDGEGADLVSSFNDLLARAYMSNEHDGVKSLLRARGFSGLGPS